MITDAVSSQKWPGDAKVHVSLVNWVKTAPGQDVDEPRLLDGVEVAHVDAALRASTSGDWQPRHLKANADRCFQGPIPVGDGFILPAEKAAALLGLERGYRDVVRPYLTSEDIADTVGQNARRWIIDFANLSLERAEQYPAALDVVRRSVKPERDTNRDPGFREKWWRFGRPRAAMRTALGGHARYAATGRHGKRLLVAWVESRAIASDATNVFAFDDDFSMGVLQSKAHKAWAWSQGSTLKGDLRYTPTSVFMTFPWAGAFATPEQREAVADACRRLLQRRRELCQQHQVGLTKLYNAMDDGAYADLRALHRELDEAVAACYGWPRQVAQDDAELVRRLTDLNRQSSCGELAYEPFAYLRS